MTPETTDAGGEAWTPGRPICGVFHPEAGQPSRVAFIGRAGELAGGGEAAMCCTRPPDHEGDHYCYRATGFTGPQVAWLHFWPDSQSPERKWSCALVDVPAALQSAHGKTK